jgi:hypothetical protein
MSNAMNRTKAPFHIEPTYNRVHRPRHCGKDLQAVSIVGAGNARPERNATARCEASAYSENLFILQSDVRSASSPYAPVVRACGKFAVLHLHTFYCRYKIW